MNDNLANEFVPTGRLKLIEAAVRLFGRDGFDGTSLRALADEAGVSWGLIRFYFGSKEGLRDAAEETVLARYLGLVTYGSQAANLEEIFEKIENDKHLPDDARFLRRAVMEERPIASHFVEQLIAVEHKAMSDSALLREFPEEAWLADPISTVARRLGYLILAPQFKSLLGRDVYSPSELKTRNRRSDRELHLLRLGLETERQLKRGSQSSIP